MIQNDAVTILTVFLLITLTWICICDINYCKTHIKYYYLDQSNKKLINRNVLKICEKIQFLIHRTAELYIEIINISLK